MAHTPAAILHLQRTVGNRAVVQLLADQREKSPVLDIVGKGGGSPLDPTLQTDMSQRLGADFSDVRIHTDSEASDSAAAVRAQAYTVGNEIVFGRNAYAPDTAQGRRIIAHELTHVQQQKSGPVSGKDSDRGVTISDPSDSFEQAAEAVAEEVLRGTTAAPSPILNAERIANISRSAVSVQRLEEVEDIKELGQAELAVQDYISSWAIACMGAMDDGLKDFSAWFKDFRAAIRGSAMEDLERRFFKWIIPWVELAAELATPESLALSIGRTIGGVVLDSLFEMEPHGDDHLEEADFLLGVGLAVGVAKTRFIQNPADFLNARSVGDAAATLEPMMRGVDSPHMVLPPKVVDTLFSDSGCKGYPRDDMENIAMAVAAPLITKTLRIRNTIQSTGTEGRTVEMGEEGAWIKENERHKREEANNLH
jgi:hypothetical protein